MIFDHILNRGLCSYMFKLRQRTGLFYSVAGDVLSGSDVFPGVSLFVTLVSKDRIKEAEYELKSLIVNAPQMLTEEEVDNAKRFIIYSLPEIYETNNNIAKIFIKLDRLKLSKNFYQDLPEKLSKINVNNIKKAAKKHLRADLLHVSRAGRI